MSTRKICVRVRARLCARVYKRVPARVSVCVSASTHDDASIPLTPSE